MEYEKMIELLREVNDSNLIEFELEDRDFRLKMKKESKRFLMDPFLDKLF